MIFRLLSMFLFLALVGCVQPIASLKTNVELTPGVTELSLKTFSVPGRITFNVQPHLGSTTTLSLLGHSSSQPLLAEINISDEDCEEGFMIRASSNKGSDYNFVYFDDPVVWGKPIAITLTWSSDRQLHIVVAGEKKSLTLRHQPHRVAANALRGSTQVDRLSFEPKS